jgi:SAM-dependent methyltransferase
MKSPISNSQGCKLLKITSVDSIVKRWGELGVDWHPDPLVSEIEYWYDDQTGLYFYTPAAAAGDEKLYIQLQQYPWYYMEDKWEFNSALDLINPSDKVLEVGVGCGFFLELCRARGIDVSGVELNPSGAARARSKGFKIFEKDLTELELSVISRKYDVIASFQVLEHVPAPLPFLRGMIANLREGGRLLLSVPNSEIMHKIDPDCSDLFNQPPHHMAHWSERAFKSLENYLPIKLISVHYEPLAEYHVGWFVSAYLRGCLGFLGRPASRLLVNRYSIYPIVIFMKLGLRNFFRGHSMLVEFIKMV